MAPPGFVHCNLHTEFSLLDSTVRIDEAVKRAAELGMPALSITDSGVMYGAFQFYKSARKHGIKPIIGCEMYVAPRGIEDRTVRHAKGNAQRLTLIAKNNEGYRNLLKLVSLAHIDGFYYKPRVDHALLEKYSGGLIAMSAGMMGEIPLQLADKNHAEAVRLAKWYRERFDFYLEVQNHGLQLQHKINQDLVKLGKELDIPIAASNDVHYLTKEDSKTHEIVLCIADGKTFEDTTRYRYPGGPEYYLKSAEEMALLFPELPEALSNTLEIAEKCHVIIETGNYKLPVYQVPPGMDEKSYMRELVWQGIRERYGDPTEEIRQRVEFELGVIERMGFASYFLVVWDFIAYARRHGISVGPGRGSAAGSIVSYALRITDIDPLAYQLLFERFLNPDRISMPDVDIDFCIDRREEVIQYVTRKYGADKVAQILTVGTLGAKQVIRDVAKTLGLPPSEADRLAKMIPGKPGTKLKDVLNAEGSDLAKEAAKSPVIQEVIEYSLKLEGNARQVGIHAAGVVISRDALDTVVPLRSEDGKLITQYTKDEVEEVGLLKMDFLGLRNLTMISKTLQILEQSRGIQLDMGTVTLEDLKSYELLSSGHTIGVFQLESSGMQKLVRNMKPNCLEDITALVALYRPGPLGTGMDVDFVERKFGRQEVSYYDPSLTELIQPILKDTYGLILYQEQIMQISRAVGGFTPGQADTLRKAMGKKQKDVMDKMKSKFVDGAENNHIRREVADMLFGVMEKFAEYGFNKSHSAAYAYVAYQTAYLKANYPVEYMAALISSVMSTQDKVPLYVGEARRMKIRILPPDINQSTDNFSVREQNIRFGLGAVKNLGSTAIENIIHERKENGPFASIFDFCKRVDLRIVNKRSIESLIKAGAFGELHPNRQQLVASLDAIMDTATRDQKARNNGQISLFDMVEDLDFTSTPPLVEIEEYGWEELLNLEKEVIGLYVSGHPLDVVKEQVEAFGLHQTHELEELEEGREVTIAGLVVERRPISTRTGKNMLVLKIEDMTGQAEVIVFSKQLEQWNNFLHENDKLLVKATIKPRRDDNDSLSVSFNSAVSLSNMSFLKVTFHEFDLQDLTGVKYVLTNHSGETPVLFCSLKDPGYMLSLGSDFWVTPNEALLNNLRKRPSIKSVILEGQALESTEAFSEALLT
jgi:DNA polymerase-3 subunit alpha